MQLITLIVGIWSVGATHFVVGAEVNTIVGVEESHQPYYKPIINDKGEERWRCIGDPSIEISYSQINDDFCDCPDGSDEPGTNACPFDGKKTFYCANEGHFPAYIENYKLNDGVCDYDVCCDGSDEYKTGLCPNRCEEIHQQYIDFKAKRVEEIQGALQIKNQLVSKAQDKRSLVKETLETKLNKVKQEQGALNVLREKLLEEASQKKEQKFSLKDTLTPHVEKMIAEMQKKDDKIARLSERNAFLEKMLSHLVENYNPNFNDLAVKQTVSGFQEYISNKEQSDENTATKENSIKNILNAIDKASDAGASGVKSEPNFSAMVHFYFKRASDWLDKRFSGEADQFHGDISSVNSELAKQISKLENTISSLTKEAKVYEQDLNKNYGPQDILRSLNSQWIRTKLGEYNYNLGIGDSVHQDNTLIGRFSHMEGNKLIYKGGSKCWNGPHRSAVVHLICGNKNSLLSVSEPEKCEYHLQLVTPIQCYDSDLDNISKEFKVDLSSLV